MRVVVFCHSLVSDWNHGNAHFLRGICAELVARGHRVDAYEPEDAWSRLNLEAEHGTAPVADFAAAYPTLRSHRYASGDIDLEAVLEDAALVLVHEWNPPALVRDIGLHRRSHGGYRLLFHDTHHRSVTDPASMARYDLRDYDGVLAFGNVVRDLYLAHGWAARAWTWHEAADTRRFMPLADRPLEGELVWIGNWGDDERTAELDEFLLEPVRTLRLKADIYGVRYPAEALRRLAAAGIAYRGWLPNHVAPEVFARHRVTVHVPRRPYVRALQGVPTIRMFEALACGIPLVSAPWNDVEQLFTPGRDFLVAADGESMRRHLQALLADPDMAAEVARHGRQTILARHTCAHRVDELLDIHAGLEAADRRTDKEELP